MAWALATRDGNGWAGTQPATIRDVMDYEVKTGRVTLASSKGGGGEVLLDSFGGTHGLRAGNEGSD